MFIVHAAIILCALGRIRVKAEIHVYVEEISIENVDPEYFDVDNSDIWIVEDSTGENTISTNVTFLKTPPVESEGHFRLTGLSMGKYDVPSGLDVTMELCDMIAEPIILGPFFAVFGLSADNCPPVPGIYIQDGYTPPTDNFPEDFPENKYLALFEVSIDGKAFITVNVYLDVQL